MVNSIIEKMIYYNERDVMRINHALKVFGYAMVIAEKECSEEQDINIVLYTAVLHDIGIKESIKKYNSSAWNYQELEGPPVAEKILSDSGIEGGIIKRVCFIIGNHHSYEKIDGLDFQIIVESDFLVNIFEKNLSQKTIQGIKKDYFKIETGLKLIDSMF